MKQNLQGPIYIIEDENGNESSDLVFKGTVTTYYKFFSRNCSDITIENLIIKTDKSKNSGGLRSMGCDIYAGSIDLSFKSILIEDLGSDDEIKYGLSRAAFIAHGWNNNPSGLVIDKLHVKSSDRHGVYITGSDHSIGEIIVDQFGVGTMKGMRGLEDAQKGVADGAVGVWLNKLTNSQIDRITINTANSKGQYSLLLDRGAIPEPSTIDAIKLIGGEKKLPIFANDLTNIVVRSNEK